MGNLGQIALQKFLPVLAEFFNEVERIEDGEKYFLFPKQVGQLVLPYLHAVVGDSHAAFLAGARQRMSVARFVEDAHGDR